MQRLYLIITLILSLLIVDPILGQAIDARLLGHWEQVGYGQIVDVDESGFTIFNICKISCEPSLEMSWQEVTAEATFQNITATSFALEMGINKYHFKRIAKMPDLCVTPNLALKDDPLHNFESLWHTFNQQYCYFETRKIDWKASKEKYRSRLTRESTDLELYIVLKEMLDEMKDGHVGIDPPDKVSIAYAEHKEAQQKKQAGKKQKKLSVNVDKTLRRLTRHYVKKITSYNISMAHWGWINDDLSYVQINGMDGWANYGISQNISENRFDRRYEKAKDKSLTPSLDEVNGAKVAMRKILADIKGSKAVVLDLRFNGGGHDEVALELLRYFTKEPTEVFSKKAFLNPGFTTPNTVSLQPAKEVYQGKVFILTSHFTASAAEIFVISSLKAIPDAIRIGSNTEGVFSDVLIKSLPNGWEYGLSNEVYVSTDGVDYESKGIPPHHEVEYDERAFWFVYNFQDMSQGDIAVEKVLELMRQNGF